MSVQITKITNKITNSFTSLIYTNNGFSICSQQYRLLNTFLFSELSSFLPLTLEFLDTVLYNLSERCMKILLWQACQIGFGMPVNCFFVYF